MAQDGSQLRCAYCDVPIAIAGQRAPRVPAAKRDPKKPPPFAPMSEATVREDAFGRFQLAVLRQPIWRDARETLRWVPIDSTRAALFLLRVVDPKSKGSDRAPREDPALLDRLARVATDSLKARRDPGLAAKAALRTLTDSGQPGGLECFVAVFDAEKSVVTTYNAGCPGALVHASVEERRTIDASTDRHGVLERLLLQGEPEAFANGPQVQLAAGDAVVIVSAGIAGEGQGWGHGSRAVHESLRATWPGGAPVTMARGVLDAFWAERDKGWRNEQPPVGDLFLVAVSVRSNLELRGDVTGDAPITTKTFESERFAVAVAPAPGAFVAWRPLKPGRRATAFVWLEHPKAEALGEKVAEGVLEVLDKPDHGDNDNPRAAGRSGLRAAGLYDDQAANLLVLWVGDQHGKVAFFTRGWRPPVDLLQRGERGGSGQQFDEGGEHWPKGGGRLFFPGALPVPERAQHLDTLATLWPGGKASALYAACVHHEDEATAEDSLRALAKAARTDVPDASLAGLCVLTRKPE